MGVTPGPWRLGPVTYYGDITLFDKDGELIAGVPRFTGGEERANAAFIAAACNAFHTAAQRLGVDPLDLAKKLEPGQTIAAAYRSALLLDEINEHLE